MGLVGITDNGFPVPSSGFHESRITNPESRIPAFHAPPRIHAAANNRDALWAPAAAPALPLGPRLFTMSRLAWKTPSPNPNPTHP